MSNRLLVILKNCIIWKKSVGCPCSSSQIQKGGFEMLPHTSPHVLLLKKKSEMAEVLACQFVSEDRIG
jgi:hypothetical protein